MFWNKKIVEYVSPKEDLNSEFCMTCGCLVRLEKLQKVGVDIVYSDKAFLYEYYCQNHKKPYQKKTLGLIDKDTKYFKQVECDKDGNIIKQK
jgi:hypothetical protein